VSDSIAARRQAWIERVLGVRLAETASAARGREGAEVARGAVNYAKLQLRWRDAQAKARASMAELGRLLLTMPEVKTDPRLAQVQKAVATLPDLIPRFGEELADHLDTLTNGGPKAADAKRDALATLATYRATLAAAAVLPRLEAFARRRLQAELPSATALSDVLAELEAAVAARG
jgi:hypothetical protein